MEAPIEEPKHLKTLRRLVNVLTIVFILGFIIIVIVIVMQFARTTGAPAMATGPALPPEIALPGSETAQAVTFGKGWIAVVTIDQDGQERIRVYLPDGMPRQSLEIGHFE